MLRATTVRSWEKKKGGAVKRTALFLELNFRNEQLHKDYIVSVEVRFVPEAGSIAECPY